MKFIVDFVIEIQKRGEKEHASYLFFTISFTILTVFAI